MAEVASRFGRVTVNASIAQQNTTGTSAANTAQTLTKAAEANKTHYVTGFEVVIRGAAAANDIAVTLRNGTTIIYRTYIGNTKASGERVGVMLPLGGLQATPNTAVTLEVTAGGAGVITEANLITYTQ